MSEAVILLVEGKRAGEESLHPALGKVGYDVVVVHTGKAAMAWLGAGEPDLIIYDGASMRSSGVRSCRRLRQVVGETPIIHTRGKGEKKNTDAGADIYLVRPFTARKVLNRVRALLPADAYEEQIVRAGDLKLYLGKRSVEVNGRETPLTPKLATLLELFLRHPNRVLERLELMQKVWQTDYVGDTRTLDVHIRWVREAIEDDPGNPRRLETVRGVGYVFRIPPLEESEQASS
ncbi:MAG: response regulator transcription factor [Candidatus Promineifilaceae bacterium]|nr:response regulator transcription factor [Candidatus Promineifilaceae bacterium]